MCIGCLMVGALLLAACSLAAAGVFERGLTGWRRLAVVGYAGGLVVGVVAVFSAFGPQAAVTAPPARVAAAAQVAPPAQAEALAMTDRAGAAAIEPRCLDQNSSVGVVHVSYRHDGRDSHRRHLREV